ncbi:MAG: hypothetical protein JNM81_12045 [Rhodospirillaceae bacterium]|nr:hypothetical protein [Rhodospirillaceae bacterium]
MTEMVTLNAAREAQQLSILVQRPDTTPRHSNSQPTISISQASVQPDAKRAAGQTEAGAQGDTEQDYAQRRERFDVGLTGPSRPRVEIRSFAPEDDASSFAPPQPSYGTTNVVADVSLPNAPSPTPAPQPAASSGSSDSSPNSLATSPVLNGRTQAEVEVAIAQQAAQTAAFAQSAPAETDLRAVRLEAAARAVRATASAPAFGSGTPDVQLKKFGDKPEAEQGFSTGEAPGSQKYYGKGSEAVVGQFATDQPQKFADKAIANQTGGLTEDGSGEAKYYDKVSQPETDFTGGGADGGQRSMYERARDVAKALSESDPDAADQAVRKYNAEAATYAAAPKAPAASPTPAVTIQVTA